MPRYSCYIVDDEPLAIDIIKSYLKGFSEFEIVGSSSDSIEALTQIKKLEPQLIFTDVQMPAIDGLELVSIIGEGSKVIVTTAYREHAVKGFDLNVLDYLVKPISLPRFGKAIGRFLEAENQKTMTNTKAEFLFIRADRKSIKLDLDEVLYIEGVKDYVKIKLSDKSYLTKASLGQFHSRLPQDKFLRAHKSYVVAKSKVSAYTNLDVEIGNIELPIGKTYRKAFLDAFKS